MVSLDYQVFCLASLALYGALHLWLRRHDGLGFPAFIWLGLIVMLVGGTFLVHQAEERERKRLSQPLLAWGPTYAFELQRHGHDQITPATRGEDPVYTRLIETQKAWLALNTQVANLYTLGRDAAGVVRVLVDSEGDFNRDGRVEGVHEKRTALGQPFARDVPALQRAFAGETVVDTQVYSDRWGTWISTFTPIRDENRTVQAVLGLDVDARAWLASLKVVRRYWIALIGLIVVVAAAFGAAFSHHRLSLRQNALSASEQALRTHFDSLPYPCWAVNRDGRFTLFNAAARKEWGRDLVGQSLNDPANGLAPETLARWENQQRRALQGDNIDSHEVSTRDGQPRHLHSMVGPVKENEHIVGVIGTQLDITARVRADEALRASEDKLAQHIRHTPLAVIEWDLRFIITAWNPAAESIFGLPAQDAVGKNGVELLFAPEAQPEVLHAWTDLLRGTGNRTGEYTHVLPDGSTRLCSWSHTLLLSPKGEKTGLASFVQDITARSDLQRQISQMQRLDSMSQLACGLAEELQGAFMPAVMHLDHLENAALRLGGLNEHVRPMREAFSRTLDLSQRLLTLGRRDATGPGPWLPLNPTVQETVEQFHRTLDPRIRLLVLLGGDLPPLPVDTSLLTTALVNVLDNAREAVLALLVEGAPPAGWRPVIRVTTTRLLCVPRSTGNPSGTRPRPYQCIEISDTGAGLDEHTREHLFVAFARRKDPRKKSGLGLAIAWKAIHSQEGWIDVSSTPGSGSSFRLYLPSPEPPAQGVAPIAQPTASVTEKPPGKHVLLAEDDELVSRTIKLALKRCGYNVTCSTDGAAALALVRLEPNAYDLIITDLNMPNLGGRDLLVTLMRDGISVPVVVLSGYLTSVVLDELQQLGAAEVVRKPLQIGDLVQVVERHTSAASRRL